MISRFSPCDFTSKYEMRKKFQPSSVGGSKNKDLHGDLSGGPVVKSPCFQSVGGGAVHRFDPWSVTRISQHNQKEKVFNMEHLLMAKNF